MIAVDTNILVYAHRRDSEWHGPASKAVRELSEGGQPWAVPWPCVHEFVAIVTSSKIYRPPSSLAAGLEQVAFWLESPDLVLIGEPEGYWEVFGRVADSARAVGGAVHDARIAAICEAQGVRELWSADRDFNRFSGLRVKNPLVQKSK